MARGAKLAPGRDRCESCCQQERTTLRSRSEVSAVEARPESTVDAWSDQVDVLVIGADGRLTRIIGFFGPAPPS